MKTKLASSERSTGRWLVRLLDTALDRSVVPGYTRIGYHVRAAFWPVDDPAPHSLSGRTAIVTGANSGIGKEIAAQLADLDARVVMVVRHLDRGADAAAEVRGRVSGADVVIEQADMSDLASVRELAQRLRAAAKPVAVLIHNAGVLPAERTESKDGYELTLATHVLGPLLLTEELRPLLAGGRVILMSSGGMYTQAVPTDDLEYREGNFRGAIAYARTKRLQVAFTPLLARRYRDDQITVASMHPGWVATPGISGSLPGFSAAMRPMLRPPEQGADTAVWLAATAPPPPAGLFWHDRRPRPTHLLPWTGTRTEQLRAAWRDCLNKIDATKESL